MHIEIGLLNFNEAIKIGFVSVYRLFCIKKFQPLFRKKLQNLTEAIWGKKRPRKNQTKSTKKFFTAFQIEEILLVKSWMWFELRVINSWKKFIWHIIDFRITILREAAFIRVGPNLNYPSKIRPILPGYLPHW